MLIPKAEWLKERHVESVAMESTGLYWIAPDEILEGQGFEVLLVDTRQLVRVPGRDKAILVAEGSDWVRRMQKSLDQMNVRVHRAVSTIEGATGMAILRAIVRGRAGPAQISAAYSDEVGH